MTGRFQFYFSEVCRWHWRIQRRRRSWALCLEWYIREIYLDDRKVSILCLSRMQMPLKNLKKEKKRKTGNKRSSKINKKRGKFPFSSTVYLSIYLSIYQVLPCIFKPTTDRPTNQQTGKRIHREYTLSLSFFFYCFFRYFGMFGMLCFLKFLFNFWYIFLQLSNF